MVALAGNGVVSISRNRAFISSGFIQRPARTEPWQAMRERMASRRSSKVSALWARSGTVNEVLQQTLIQTCPDSKGEVEHIPLRELVKVRPAGGLENDYGRTQR